MEAIDCGKVSLKELSGYAQWSMEIATPWNQQANSFDCGVFCDDAARQSGIFQKKNGFRYQKSKFKLI